MVQCRNVNRDCVTIRFTIGVMPWQNHISKRMTVHVQRLSATQKSHLNLKPHLGILV